MSIWIGRAVVAALGVTALVPSAATAARTPSAPSEQQRADVAPPVVTHWEAEVVRDRLRLLPSKADVTTTVTDATAVAAVSARFVRGTLVHGGQGVNTHGNSWRVVFDVPAADTTGIYEVWVDAKDARGNAAATKVGTLTFP